MRVVVLFITMLLVFTVGGQNLILNGDLKQGAKHWTFGSWTKTPGKREIKKEGNVSFLSLSNYRDNKFATLCIQQVKLKPNTTYVFKFKMRTKDVKRQLPKKITHGAGISFTAGKILFSGAAKTWTMIQGNSNLTEYRGVFKTGNLKKNQLVSVYPSLTFATGTADFTAFYLAETKENIAPKVVKPKNQASLFPVEFQNGVYNVAQNFIGTFVCTFRGKKPASQKIVFELPNGFEIVGGSSIRPAVDKGKVWQWSFEKAKVEKLKNNLTRYTLVLPPHFIKDWGSWNNEYRVFIKATGKVNLTGNGVWYATGNPPSPLKLKVLPPIDYTGKVPTKFSISPTFVPNLVGTSKDILNQHLKLWKSLSTSQYMSIDPWAWKHVDKKELEKILKGFNTSMVIGSSGSMIRLGFKRWKEQHPIARKTKFPLCIPNATREPSETLCPNYLIEDPQKLIWDDYVPTLLKDRAGNMPVNLIEFDYEPHPNKHCFCSVCLSKFRAFSKLKGSLTREIILSKYANVWFKFRVEQHRQIIKRYYDSCRKHFPKTKISLVTDILHHQGSTIADWCAVDCRLSDNIGLDYMRNMPYFEGVSYYDTMDFNLKKLKTSQFPLIDPTERTKRFYIRYTPKGVKLNIVATAMLGGKGIGFWLNDYFDGAYIQQLVNGSRIVAAGEDFYFNGKRCDDKVVITPKNTVKQQLIDDGEKFVLQTPDFPPYLRYTVHAKGDNLLLTIINYHPKEDVILEIQVKDKNKVPAALAKSSKAEEYEKGKYLVKINASDAGVWLLSKNNKAIKAGNITTQLRKFNSTFSKQKLTDNKVNFGLLRPEKIAVVKLASKNRNLYVNQNNQALIVGWPLSSSALNDILYLHGSRGNLGELALPFLKGQEKFDASLNGKDLKFSYVVPSPEDANPEAEKYTGIKIEKNISLVDNGNTIIVKYDIINSNASGKNLEFFGRIKNLPMLGTLIPEGKQLASYGVIKSGKLISAVGAPVSTLWHKDKAKLEFNTAKTEKWNGDKVSLTVSAFGEEESLEFSFDKSCYGVHFWRQNEGVLTVEGLYHFNIPWNKKVSITQKVKYFGVQKSVKKNFKLNNNFTGIVFEDKNNNQIQDANELGIANVLVSNGIDVVRSNKAGLFTLPKNSKSRFIFASRPAGYKCSTKFFAPIESENFNFGFTKQKKRPLTFFQVTDTESIRPEKWLDEVKTLGAKYQGDFLLHTGDILGVKEHAIQMPKCNMDVFTIPGNHDLKKTGIKNTREVYEKHLGPVYYSFEAGNLKFLQVVYARNIVDSENQLTWLKNELALLEPNKKFVIVRHEPPQYSDKITKFLLDNYSPKIAGFICGHTHSHLVRTIKNIPIFESVSTPAGGLDHSPRAFRLFQEQNGKLISQTIYSNPLKIKNKIAQVNINAPKVNLNAKIKTIKSPFMLKWVVKTNGVIHYSAPIIANNKVFAAINSDDNPKGSYLLAIDAITGKTLWKRILGSAIKGGIVADSNNIYSCGVDGLVQAVSQNDGKILWQAQIKDVDKTNGMYGKITLSNNKLYLYNEGPIIVDCKLGKIIYQGKSTFEGGGVWLGGVTIANNIGISGVNWRYGLKGFDLTTGKILWTLAKNRDFTYLDAAPTFYDGKIYFKGRKKIFVIDPLLGKILKEVDKNVVMETPSRPYVNSKFLIIGSIDGIHAYDRVSLKKVWSYKPGRSLIPATGYCRSGYEVTASPVVIGNTIIVGALDGKLYLLNLVTGKKIQDIQLDSSIMTSCALAGNACVVTTLNGNVYMLTI